MYVLPMSMRRQEGKYRNDNEAIKYNALVKGICYLIEITLKFQFPYMLLVNTFFFFASTMPFLDIEITCLTFQLKQKLVTDFCSGAERYIPNPSRCTLQ